MMNGDQQAIRRVIAQVEQGEAHDRSLREMKARLDAGRRLFEDDRPLLLRQPGRQVDEQKGGPLRQTTDLLAPARTLAEEAQPQRVVMGQEVGGRPLEEVRREGFTELEQHGLVEVV